MSVAKFTDGLEPADQEAVIWRFMRFPFFEDLIKTGQLYFARADRFDDDQEGLPPEEYVDALGLNRFDLNDIHERDHHIGNIACGRQAMYLCCWYLFGEETGGMWTQFAPEGGVAIVSRYSRLKAFMEPITFRPHLGLVRYGSGDITTWNTIRFISTKRARYAHEREVRAMLWPEPPPHDGVNRHIDINNIPRPGPVYGTLMPCGYRPQVDLRRLITDIIVSPYATSERLAEVQALIHSQLSRCRGPVRRIDYLSGEAVH